MAHSYQRNVGGPVGKYFLACCLHAFIIIAAAQTAYSQDGRLNVDLAGATPRVRSNAPVMLILKAYWNGSSIVEGNFEVKYYADGHSLRSETTSHDVVLSPGEQTIRLNLPTAGSTVSFGQDEVALKFIAENETFDLKRYPLIVGQGERTMNVCVVGPTDRGAQSDAEVDLTDALRLGDLLDGVVSTGGISTVFTHWDVADVPEQPLLLCSFDLVVLRPEGLADMRKKQLDGLLGWVRAGGSVCVMLSKELDGKHVDFLNKLVAESQDTPFILDTSGQFVADEGTANEGSWRAHLELGRVEVVDLEKLPVNQKLLWRKSRSISGFLWKIRRDIRDSTLASQQRSSQSRSQQNMNPPSRRRRQNAELAWQPIASIGRFVSELMPEDVKVVPMGLIALLLFGYLLLIGPIDYYVLGHFKIRRFTWLMFPLMTALIAFLCVWISEAYLASKTTGKSLIVRDMGADGSVLRESEFELKFLSRRADVTTDLNNRIFTPMDSNRLMLGTRYAYQYQYAGQSNPGGNKQVQYVGRIPGSYKVQQEITQWRPQVNRSLSIAPDLREDGFPWADTELAKPASQDKLRQAIATKWPKAKAFVFTLSKKRRVTQFGQIFKREKFNDDYRYQRWNREQGNSGSFTDSLCRRINVGFFGFVSQIAPNGGDNFEDLTLLDSSDRGQAVLVIAVEEADKLVLYRRLYTGLNEKK